MPGDYEMKFAGLRAFLGYMMTHPGKKLTFMGAEFGQFREWDTDSGLDWLLLDYPMHSNLRRFVKELGAFYLATPELWEIDYSWEGFRWISEHDRDQNIIAFTRTDKKGVNLISLINFAPVTRHDYRFGVPERGTYTEVFNSDLPEYGGWGHANKDVKAEKIPFHGFKQSISITAPPLATVCFRRLKRTKEEEEELLKEEREEELLKEVVTNGNSRAKEMHSDATCRGAGFKAQVTD